MAFVRFIYALYLRLTGLGLVAIAAFAYSLDVSPPPGVVPPAIPASVLVAAAILGVAFLIPWLLPRGLRQPRKPHDLIWIPAHYAVVWLTPVLCIPLLAVASQMGHIPPELVEQATAANPIWSLIVPGVLAVILILPKLFDNRPDYSEDPTIAPHIDIDEYMHEKAVEQAVSAPRSLPNRLTIWVSWALLRIGGLILLVPAAYLAHSFWLADDGLWANYVPDGRRTGIGLVVLALIAIAYMTPIPVSRQAHLFMPVRLRQIVRLPLAAFGVYAAGAFLAPAWPAALAKLGLGWTVPAILLEQRWAFALVAVCAVTLITIVTYRPLPKELKKAPRKSAASAMTGQKIVPASRQSLPALGVAMKAYGAADWLIMRLFGLGLLGTAYMTFGMIQQGSARLPELIYNQDPWYALYAYAGLGAFMAIPFIMPRFLAEPRTVFMALVKAAMLVGTAFILIPPLQIAIVTFTPQIYHQTLLVAVPLLFKSLAGIAVTSTVIVALFRQLGALPKLDYKGDPISSMSSNQLHALRKARMPGA
ncbi:hypothetical protein [Jannaschia pohangensis]|uniref:Uncharacterized protein n=1 Tax=Jannaschia pohangensis TaxID=390807 RepID=A0A1I3H3I4_9RHOB|nr:hypothetical protein [Jannaschia pohangensis]SFI30117.1 hypothetical protein SAMN04488095_0434 [Jannaschia pohangensis]